MFEICDGKNLLHGIAALERESFSDPWSESMLEESAEAGEFLAAVEEGEILGYALFLIGPFEHELLRVCVRESERRRGIAAALIGKKLAEKSCEKLLLEVRRQNAPAVALYKKLGFCEDGLRPAYYSAPEDDAVLMSITVK